MFEIDDITDSYAFPTIDFKFLNRDKHSAIIKQFTVEVLEAEIDPTPSLSFTFDVARRSHVFRGDDVGNWEGDDSLIIYARNNGWGSAFGLELTLNEPNLNQLLRKSDRNFKGDINSEQRVAVLQLQASDVNHELVTRLHREGMASARNRMERELPEFLKWNEHMTVENGYDANSLAKAYEEHQHRARQHFDRQWGMPLEHHISEAMRNDQSQNPLSIPISRLNVDWRCTDEHGTDHDGSQDAKGWPDGWDLYLTPHGFVYNEHHVLKCALGSDVTFCTLIDPSLGQHHREYPISRVVPAGDVERFHIMIGGTKSSRLTVRFSFTLNEKDTVTSDEFELKLWNPADHA